MSVSACLRPASFFVIIFFFSSRRRHTRFDCDWSSDVCSSDLGPVSVGGYQTLRRTDVVSPPPVTGSIVGMDVRIVDASGQVVPQDQLMLHHDMFANGGPRNSRRDGACPQRDVRERFFGTSEALRAL